MHLSYYKRTLFWILILQAVSILVYYKIFGFKVPRVCYGSKIEARAKIISYPQEAKKYQRIYAEIISVNGEKKNYRVVIYSRKISVSCFDRVILKGVINPVDSTAVLPASNWRRYLEIRNILGEMHEPEIKIFSKPNFLFRTAVSIHEYMSRFFSRNFAEYSSIVSGIVMGDRKGMSFSLKRAFQDSGAMHLLVASGSNVGFIAFIIYLLGSFIGLGKRCSYVFSLFFCGIYVVSAGMDPPLKRAFIMFAFALAGFALERESGAFQGLLVAAFLILVFNPKALFDAGFQMSFIATYSIIVGMGSWKKIIWGINRYLMPLFAVSFFAQISLYPLIGHYFQRVSFISGLSNMIFVPMSAVIMFSSFVGAFVEKIPYLGVFLISLAKYFVVAFKFLVVKTASMPFSAGYVASPGIPFMTGYFAIVFIVLHYPLFKQKNKVLVPLVIAFFLLLATHFVRERREIYLAPSAGGGIVFLKEPGCGMMVFNPSGNGTRISRAVLGLGENKIKALFFNSLSWPYSAAFSAVRELKTENLFVPFGRLNLSSLEDIRLGSEKGTYLRSFWPGEEVVVCGLRAKARWAAFKGRNGEFTRKGFSGDYDRISWEIYSKNFGMKVYAAGRTLDLRIGDAKKEIRLKKGKIVKVTVLYR